MPEFDVDALVADLREAAVADDAAGAVRSLMEAAFADPEAVRAGMAGFTGEECVLFEDDTVSIWYCGFDPTIHVPPHDHRTHAVIGVYDGLEDNHFYLARDGALERRSTRHMVPGDVIALAPHTIHSVETTNAEPSYGIHVYLAPLTRVERSLYDWETGVACPFTDEAYARLRRVSET